MLLPLLALVLKLLVRHTHCYNERLNCAPYSQDISGAVDDFAAGVGATQDLFNFPRPKPDISNLRQTLFRGMNFADQSPLSTAPLTPVNQLYLDLGKMENFKYGLEHIESITFSCAPTTFTQHADPENPGKELWFDSDTRLWYNVAANLLPENGVICPPGQKTRLAYAGWRAIIILCAEVLTQTDGQPKMFQKMDGMDLTHNDRATETVFPSDYYKDLPEDVTQNAFSWPGMQIDQLRQRVLSVYIGRNIIALVGIDRGITSRTYTQIRSNLARSYFYGASLLTWDKAYANVDSYSLLITGYWYSVVMEYKNKYDSAYYPHRLASWWRENGTLWWPEGMQPNF